MEFPYGHESTHFWLSKNYQRKRRQKNTKSVVFFHYMPYNKETVCTLGR